MQRNAGKTTRPSFERLLSLAAGIGISCGLRLLLGAARGHALSALALFYLFKSLSDPPSWSRCDNSWNTAACHAFRCAHWLHQPPQTTARGILRSRIVIFLFAKSKGMQRNKNCRHNGGPTV